nr:hypothetical protein [Rhizobium leguminosarum]
MPLAASWRASLPNTGFAAPRSQSKFKTSFFTAWLQMVMGEVTLEGLYQRGRGRQVNLSCTNRFAGADSRVAQSLP